MKFRGPQFELLVERNPLTGLFRAVNLKENDPTKRAQGLDSPGIVIGYNAASDDEEQCMIQYDFREACTLTLFMDGNYSLWKGSDKSIPFPFRIEYKLFVGVGGCMADDDPFVGIATLTSLKDFSSREGRLFQVVCIPNRTVWFCARIVDPLGQVMVRLSVRSIFDTFSGGHPTVIVGTAIG